MGETPEAVTIDILRLMRNIADTAVVNLERGKTTSPIKIPNIGGPGGPLDDASLEPLTWTQVELDSLEERVREAVTKGNKQTQAAQRLIAIMEAMRQFLPSVSTLL